MVISRENSAESSTVAKGEETQVSKDILLKRLKRIEGQLRGIQKMIAEDRDCVNIVISWLPFVPALRVWGLWY
jgi:hypothetical protein